jgi:endonuclease-3
VSIQLRAVSVRRRRSAYGPAEVEEMFRRFALQRPEPKGELDYVNPFTLLVAVVLSAQATDVGVNRATRPLFRKADTPEKMAKLGEAELGAYIRTIGLFNTKAKNILKTCRILVDEHGGEVPRDRTALEALPGVGRKTANVILNTAFGEPTIAVDTHIFRVANRTGLAPGANVRAVVDALLARVPKAFLKYAHHWLNLHGRYTCKARRPLCGECVIADLCEWPGRLAGTETH